MLNHSQRTMTLLPSIVADPSGSRPHQPLILVQSSVSQTCLPVLRTLIQPAKRPAQTLLFCFLYPPASLIADWPNTSNGSLKVFDYTGQVPGYDEVQNSRDEILTAVRSGQSTLKGEDERCSPQTVPPGSLHVIIDSVDTLATDLASNSQTYKFIKSLLSLITSRSRMCNNIDIPALSHHVRHRTVCVGSASSSLSFTADIDTDPSLGNSDTHNRPPSIPAYSSLIIVPHTSATCWAS